MLSRTLKTAGLLGAGILIFASMALGASHSISLGQNVVLPGGATLKAATYKVVLNTKTNQIEFVNDYKVVAKTAYKLVSGPRNEATAALTEQTPEGKVLLRGIQMGGETGTISLGD